MPLQIFVEPRGGEYLARGIEQAGESFADVIRGYKRRKEQGKISDQLYKHFGLENLSEEQGGIPKEAWDTFGSSEKWTAIQGITRSMVLQQEADRLDAMKAQEAARLDAMKAQTEATKQATELNRQQMKSSQAFPAALAAALTTATTTPMFKSQPSSVPMEPAQMRLNTTPTWGNGMNRMFSGYQQPSPQGRSSFGPGPQETGASIPMRSAGQLPMRPANVAEQFSSIAATSPNLLPSDALAAMQQAQALRGEVPGMSAALNAALAAGLQPSETNVKLPGGASMKFDRTAELAQQKTALEQREKLVERTTKWGIAPTPKLASDFTDYMTSIEDALPKIDELIQIGEAHGREVFDREIIGRAEVLSGALQAALRLPLIGPGAMSDEERKKLEKIAADPTKFYTGRGIASLKELRSQLTKGADVRAKSYRINGYTPIAGGGVQSSVGIGQDRVFPNEADATSAAQPGQSVRFYRVNPQTGIPEIVTGTME